MLYKAYHPWTYITKTSRLSDFRLLSCPQMVISYWCHLPDLVCIRRGWWWIKPAIIVGVADCWLPLEYFLLFSFNLGIKCLPSSGMTQICPDRNHISQIPLQLGMTMCIFCFTSLEMRILDLHTPFLLLPCAGMQMQQWSSFDYADEWHF